MTASSLRARLVPFSPAPDGSRIRSANASPGFEASGPFMQQILPVRAGDRSCES